MESANASAQYRKHPDWQYRHVTYWYELVRLRKGHAVVGAVARSLAEETFWILNKIELAKNLIAIHPGDISYAQFIPNLDKGSVVIDEHASFRKQYHTV